MTRRAAPAIVLTALVAAFVTTHAAQDAGGPASTAPAKTPMAYADAAPLLERLRPNLPAQLSSKTGRDLEAAWPGWVARRDSDIRGRVEQGDEDSLVNFLLFGTTFTKLPRALNDSARMGGPTRAGEIVRGRIADFIAAVGSPGTNERLIFARELIRRRGIDPKTTSGKEQLRQYVLGIMRRGVTEVNDYLRTIQSARALADAGAEFAARSTLFHTRGLSTDTSIRPDFALDQALDAAATKGLLGPNPVRRVAVIGPGLDFTDKAEGFDFYPQQTTQPFAVVNTLVRLRLATVNDLRVATFDLSSRVNQHLLAARQRARNKDGYTVALPRDRDSRWRPDLLQFWKTFGDRIGDETKAVPPPAGTNLEMRAVRIRPEIVLSIEPWDLNVILERIAPLAPADRFDLIVATNVLVYYDAFEQSLALANIAAMLRPGGLFLSNNALREIPPTPLHSAGSITTTYSDAPDDNDFILSYQRQ